MSNLRFWLIYSCFLAAAISLIIIFGLRLY